MTPSRRLRVSGPARADLAGIGDYTGRVWGIAQKNRYLGAIGDRFRTLLQTPGLGAPRDDISRGLRALVAERHVIFYRETETEVRIVRVLHANMDVEVMRERDP